MITGNSDFVILYTNKIEMPLKSTSGKQSNRMKVVITKLILLQSLLALG